jgi:BirA family biotin operon repressor/biotin-[acetyl-CoA-carboxylase] ligase
MHKALNAQYYPSVASTQEIAREWVMVQDRTYNAAYTDHQTAGRGRQGALWHDEPGSSLLVSYLLWDRPLQKPVGVFSLLVAVAIAEALEVVLPPLPELQIKYPNDLMLNEHKVGGILIEIVNGVAIVGVGVNLAQESFPEPLKHPAISLRQVLGELPALPEQLRDKLLQQIWNHTHDGLARYRHDPHSLWQACVRRDGTRGRRYRILDLEGQPEGVALRLEPDFRLCLQRKDGKTHCTYFVESIS